MNQSAYERMLQIVLDTVQSAVIAVDGQNRLRCCKLPGSRCIGQHFVGKPLERLLRLVLHAAAADQIVAAVNDARKSKAEIKIEKLACENLHAMEYYLHVSCCFLGSGMVIIFLNNITESVLLVKEFSSMLEEHAASVAQLEASIAELELQLMKKS